MLAPRRVAARGNGEVVGALIAQIWAVIRIILEDVSVPRAHVTPLVEKELAAKGGFAILPTVDRAGVYHARWTVPRHGSAVIIANLTSERESDVRARKIAVDANAGTVTASRVADAHHEWGLWLALAALAFIAFDVFWLTRKKNVSKIESVAAATSRAAAAAAPAAKAEATKGGS